MRGTTEASICSRLFEGISIHVPREGHDLVFLLTLLRLSSISIHVPREGHDGWLWGLRMYLTTFLSTCPVRGTTPLRVRPDGYMRYFYPRAP